MVFRPQGEFEISLRIQYLNKFCLKMAFFLLNFFQFTLNKVNSPLKRQILDFQGIFSAPKLFV
jgi:hypothetical protein